jgi:hypothetical protein
MIKSHHDHDKAAQGVDGRKARGERRVLHALLYAISQRIFEFTYFLNNSRH